MDQNGNQSTHNVSVPGLGSHATNTGAPVAFVDSIEAHASAEPWHRVYLPPPKVLPPVDGHNLGTLVVSLAHFLRVAIAIGYNYFTSNVVKFFLLILRWFVPPTLATVQQRYVNEVHAASLARKWAATDTLPSYVSQLNLLHVLRSIGHTGIKESDGILRTPEECATTSLVRLQLDAHGRPFVRAEVEGVDTSFLVDTGASVSVLTFDSYNSLPNKSSLPRIQHVPAVYDHQHNKLNANFGVLCHVILDGKTIIIPFIVSHHSSSNILGTDTLVGRCLSLAHHGTEAFLIVGEIPVHERPKVKLADRSALYVVHDAIVPGEGYKRITVTPFVFPAKTDIPSHYFSITYVDTLDGVDGLTTHAKLDEHGCMTLRVRNRSIIDWDIPKCSILAFGQCDPSYRPPKRDKRHRERVHDSSKDDQPHSPSLAGRIELTQPSSPSNDVDNSLPHGSSHADGSHSRPKGASRVDADRSGQGMPSPTSADARSPEISTTGGDPGKPAPPTLDAQGSPSHMTEALHPRSACQELMADATPYTCFCQLPSDCINIIIRGNKFGDTISPYLSYVGYTREPRVSGRFFSFRRGARKVYVLYGATVADREAAIATIPDDGTTAYVVNMDEDMPTGSKLRVRLDGSCKLHPFPYNAKPTIISLAITDVENTHRIMLNEFKLQTILHLANIFTEVYYDPQIPKQLHMVIHVPEIITLQAQLLQNYLAAMIVPFAPRLQVVEPYTGTINYRFSNFIFNLNKIAELLKVQMQSRNPKQELTSVPTGMAGIKKCACSACMADVDKRLYHVNNNASIIGAEQR